MVSEAAEMGGLVVVESHEASARVGGVMKWRLAQSACFCVIRDVRERLHERAGGCIIWRHDQREAGRDDGEAEVVHYYGAKVVRARRRRRASTGTFRKRGGLGLLLFLLLLLLLLV